MQQGIDMDLEMDAVEKCHLQKTVTRRQALAAHLPKLWVLAYLCWAVFATYLCLTTFRPTLENLSRTVTRHADGLTSDADTNSYASMMADSSDAHQSDEFVSQYYCDIYCSSGSTRWCCSSGNTCGSSAYACESANLGLALTIIILIILAIWFGPLIIYIIIITLVRVGQAGRFQALANSGQYESWVVVSGCFQMSLNESSGNAEFNQAAYNLVNAYGGCGDECVMHCIGVWFCSTCYPCCMCCVSAARNQSKVGSLQAGLSRRGYNTHVQFLSAIIPACCNSIFIGLVSKIQTNVMVVASNGGVATMIYAQPNGQYSTAPGAPAAYPYAQQPGPYAQPQYGQPQLQYAPPQYGQPVVLPAGASVSVPPDVVKSQPPEVIKSTV